ncbi:MAG TPA: rhodanese-like domain-containing protein [Usitatibacter sp.]|nr:rhodanese-like domain-containing protein [Usitatibacter sp.]
MGEFLLNNWPLVLLFLASGTMLVAPDLLGFAGGTGELGTLDATRLMNQGTTLVLDVRDAQDFASGHLPRARHIPVADLSNRMSEIEKYKEKPVLVTCMKGNRSATAAKLLRRAGFKSVFHLKGGLAAWQQACLPLEK